MQLNKKSRQAWKVFMANQDNHGHVNRELSGSDIDNHVQACWESSKATATRIKSDLPSIDPKIILEIGSSTGLNCYALQKIFPAAEVIGIEPETQAVEAARAMLQSDRIQQPRFEQGFGEALPLDDNSIDLIVCHTVIEHVNNVEEVITEMARVLSDYGVIHLDAPNYRFPYEPHLGIFTIPELGKSFVKLTTFLQGQWKNRSFVDHIKFVTPGLLEGYFLHNGMKWENRAIEKVNKAFNGTADVKKYRKVAWFLSALQKLGLGTLAINIIAKLGVYPSVLYTVTKQ